MRYENGKIVGDITVTDEFRLDGMVVGNVTVAKGGTLTMNGTVTERLIFEDGSTGYVNGTIAKDIVHRGGVVEIRGTVRGGVRGFPGPNGGSVWVDPAAVVGTR